TINTMVDQLRSFAGEVTRVAREVGTEGKLGGQANVEDVSGTWRDLTDSVNSMASNLTDQVRAIAPGSNDRRQGKHCEEHNAAARRSPSTRRARSWSSSRRSTPWSTSSPPSPPR